MSNVRIGPDGSIIKDDVVIETDGRTVIREDGTIETTSVGGHMAPPQRVAAINTPPVSPLERRSSNNNAPIFQDETRTNETVVSRPSGPVNQREVKEKEYEIQRMDGRIKNAVSKPMIIATVILCILGLAGLYFLFIPAIVTGIIVIVGFSKKSELEAERSRLYEELQQLERGGR